jgi:hypothetical protein
MLWASIIGAGASAISRIIQGSQARRAAKENYNRVEKNLAEQGKAERDKIKQYHQQGQEFLGGQTVSIALSGLKGSSLDLSRGTSASNINRDITNMRTQADMNYSSGMEQAGYDMNQAYNQGTASILGGVGEGLVSAANIYAQGVNTGRWTPGRDASGAWRANLNPYKRLAGKGAKIQGMTGGPK